MVFGSIDGIFSVLGIIAAGSSAGLTGLPLFATGLGGATAGALSVFAAMYLSQTTEKKTRLLAAWENSRKIGGKKARNGNDVLRQPSKKEHKRFHELLSRVHRRALLAGLVTSTTSTLASLALLLPLVFLSAFSPAVSILTGIMLLATMGAFRGVTLKQSAAKSAIKMIVLGVVIIVASNVLGSYVQTLLRPHP